MQPITSAAISAITFLLGLYLGNRLALGRDRRKEFNETIAPIRTMLLAQKDHLQPHSKYVEQNTVDFLKNYYWWPRRRRFLKIVERYREARLDEKNQYQDMYGEPFYQSTAELKSIIDELLSDFLSFRK